MKNQTLSIERMLHLKKLGVDTSKASMCWLKAKKRILYANPSKLSFLVIR